MNALQFYGVSIFWRWYKYGVGYDKQLLVVLDNINHFILKVIANDEKMTYILTVHLSSVRVLGFKSKM